MSIDDIATLNRKRGAIKHKFTNFNNYLTQVQPQFTASDADIDSLLNELSIRSNNFEVLWTEFEAIQINIECSLPDDKIDEQYALRTSYYDTYTKSLVTARGLLKKYSPRMASEPGSSVPSNASGSKVECAVEFQQVKLPIIELPKFSGNFNSWLEFKDTFESLIHRNECIVDIQKFHYLKASLQGDALKVIQAFDFTAVNYNLAWQSICDRYNNKRLLIQNHIKSIFELEQITKESARSLRNLVDSVFKHLRALESLGQQIKHWDAILIYIIIAKIDKTSIREWERGKGATESPTLDSFRIFLNERADFLETFELNHSNKYKENSKMENKRSSTLLGASNTQDKIISCNFCRGKHVITQCQDYLSLSVSDRLQKAKQLKLCLNCLCYGHSYFKCRSKACTKCSKKHNVLLHIDEVWSESSNKTNDQGNRERRDTQYSLISSQNINSFALLSTVVLLVSDAYGNYHTCRAILDNGSMSNLITDKLVKRLHLAQNKSNISIVGINQLEIELKYSCNLKIKSRISDFENTLSCVIVPNKITDNLPIHDIDISSWKIPEHIKLADTEFNLSSEVDLLIGAQLFWDLLQIGNYTLGKSLPVLQNTVFGWIVSGSVNQRMVKSYCNFIKLTNEELDNSLTKFWELEDVDHDTSIFNSDERICESHFVDNYSRDDDGRFVVRIPLKFPREKLGDSKQMAIKRFLKLESRLNKDDDLKMSYDNFMREYIDLNHMELSNLSNGREICEYFLPHHGVWRPESLSTKLRVVFDGSAVTTSGLSLNDIQFKGPSCLNDVTNILIRFRKHKYVVCADIAKMYRQILVHEDDRSLQQIFWRFNSSEPLLIYTLKTVTYGTASAPYLAIRCLKQISEDVRTNYPQASRIISDDFYVDDLITGFDDKITAISICNDIKKILNEGGFSLRKWSSNCSDILAQQDYVDRDSHLLFNNDETIKTLGMSWNHKSDTISFCVKNPLETETISKRTILSGISKIFDPLGLISPCVILIKILIQKLWVLKLNWDMPVPFELERLWLEFTSGLCRLNVLERPRQVICSDAMVVEIHGFCDASCEAYAAAVYLRSIAKNGDVHVHLISSKTKVAPLKQKLTVPKLELSGALLLARLIKKVVSALTLNDIKCFMWCDSQIVLAWIKNTSKSLPRFEANRVNQIQNLSNHYPWFYVNTKNNPADIATRGILPNLIEHCNLWWYGPNFLKSPNCEWSIPPGDSEYAQTCLLSTSNCDIFNKFSNFTRLNRVVAYCLRFCHNAKHSRQNRQSGHLTVTELCHSLNMLIKMCQLETFSNELKLLYNKKLLPKNNNLSSLAPFLDQNGIMRVGGRLSHSNLCYNSKHPVLLSGNHSFTKLIIEHEHKKLLHAGPQLLLATIRQNYWPTSGMNAVKRVTKGCITCYKAKPDLMTTYMSDLPESRVKINSPFYNTGIDYAGPFFLKNKKGRGAKFYKVYVCVFVCFTTKALHLEVVSDLTTDSFIATLRRFVARRGKPSVIHSDNATNFVGAQRELKIIYEFLQNSTDQIADMCANDNIGWKFIPPSAPHFGGIWEAAVKSCKYHLLRVIGNTHLTYEEFHTVLIQIEAILNSRPMYALSSDPNDFLPLTPSHFLIGKPLTMVADPDLAEIRINKLSRFQLLQKLNQDFWKSWSKEYFASLQKRNKWKMTSAANIKLHALVLLKDENLPPCKWITGRVVELHPGSDNIVRVVTIKTPYGVLKRAITKLCLLPVPET